MKDEILKIINKIREAKNVASIDELRPQDRLRDDLGFTSFDLAELTVNIEDKYDIDIFEDGLVDTVGEILNKLEK